MKQRFIVVDEDEAMNLGWLPRTKNRYRGVLFDTSTIPPTDVGRDGGEPEDQTLFCDWSWVVDLCNRLATTMSLEVRFRFRNEEEKDFFMGQLCDGWGENLVNLKWEGNFDEAEVFDVDPTVDEDLWNHHRRFSS